MLEKSTPPFTREQRLSVVKLFLEDNHVFLSPRVLNGLKAKARYKGTKAVSGIEIPRTRTINNYFLLWFLERFPLLEKLLNLLR